MVSEDQDPYLCARIDVLTELMIMLVRRLEPSEDGRAAIADELRGRTEQGLDHLLQHPVVEEYLTESTEYAEHIAERILWTPKPPDAPAQPPT